jgi:hypothetical protein
MLTPTTRVTAMASPRAQMRPQLHWWPLNAPIRRRAASAPHPRNLTAEAEQQTHSSNSGQPNRVSALRMNI